MLLSLGHFYLMLTFRSIPATIFTKLRSKNIQYERILTARTTSIPKDKPCPCARH